LIAALVNEYHKTHGLPTLETYSIGLAESTDLKYARLVAGHLGTKHTEVILTEREFCEAIPEVVEAIESYDTTTVRASIGNYLLGKYIAANSEAKVIFNGDGSDELLGGYLYMKMAPDAIEFDQECRRLLKDIHAFDVLRSDKSISSHGLEPRTPFLDRDWTQFYLSISPTIRRGEPGDIEKYLLRSAFARTGLLPEDVLWRRKEAFSDGVSGQERSLYQILQEYCGTQTEMVKNHPDMGGVITNFPKTAEQVYYRQVFERCYPGQGSIVPYFWMPKYVEATDASARTLATYDNT
jgi:asparagine synthase (glutamine-hydrolysing)